MENENFCSVLHNLEAKTSSAAFASQCEQLKVEKADIEKRLLQSSGSSDQLTGLLEQKNAELAALQKRFDETNAEHARIFAAKSEELDKVKVDFRNLNENFCDSKAKSDKLAGEFEKLMAQIAGMNFFHQ